MYTIFVVTWF